MSDDHEKGPLLTLHFQKQLSDRGAGFGVEIAGRFVGEEEDRLLNKGPGDGCALAFSAGDLGRTVVFPLGEPDTFQEHFGTRRPLRGSTAPGQRGHEDVFENRTLREEVMFLEDKPDSLVAESGEAGFVQFPQVDVVEKNAAARRLIQRAEDIQKRALTGTAGTDDGKALTRGEFKRDVVQNAQSAVACGELSYNAFRDERHFSQ